MADNSNGMDFTFGIGSAIGGLFGGIGSAFAASKQAEAQRETNAMNYRIAQENNQFNERMWQKQADYNTDMWNKTNAYNSPLNQRQLLAQAGYNPLLAVGSGAQGFSASQVGAPSAQPASEVGRQEAPDYSGYRNIGQDIAQIVYALEQTRGQAIENEYKGAINLAKIDELRSKTKFQSAQTYLTMAEEGLKKQMTSNALQQFNLNSVLNPLLIRQQKLQNQNLEYTGQNLLKDLDKKDQEIAESKSRIEVNDNNIKVALARLVLNREEIKQGWYRAQTERQKVQNDFELGKSQVAIGWAQTQIQSALAQSNIELNAETKVEVNKRCNVLTQEYNNLIKKGDMMEIQKRLMEYEEDLSNYRYNSYHGSGLRGLVQFTDYFTWNLLTGNFMSGGVGSVVKSLGK